MKWLLFVILMSYAKSQTPLVVGGCYKSSDDGIGTFLVLDHVEGITYRIRLISIPIIKLFKNTNSSELLELNSNECVY